MVRQPILQTEFDQLLALGKPISLEGLTVVDFLQAHDLQLFPDNVLAGRIRERIRNVIIPMPTIAYRKLFQIAEENGVDILQGMFRGIGIPPLEEHFIQAGIHIDVIEVEGAHLREPHVPTRPELPAPLIKVASNLLLIAELVNNRTATIHIFETATRLLSLQPGRPYVIPPITVTTDVFGNASSSFIIPVTYTLPYLDILLEQVIVRKDEFGIGKPGYDFYFREWHRFIVTQP